MKAAEKLTRIQFGLRDICALAQSKMLCGHNNRGTWIASLTTACITAIKLSMIEQMHSFPGASCCVQNTVKQSA